MKITDLFKKKSDLEREIAARRAVVTNAEKALALCGRVEKELPERIRAIESQPVALAFSDYAAPEDFSGRGDLIAQREQIAAARALLADIPEIRAHWEKVRASLN